MSVALESTKEIERGGKKWTGRKRKDKKLQIEINSDFERNIRATNNLIKSMCHSFCYGHPFKMCVCVCCVYLNFNFYRSTCLKFMVAYKFCSWLLFFFIVFEVIVIISLKFTYHYYFEQRQKKKHTPKNGLCMFIFLFICFIAKLINTFDFHFLL